MKIVLNWERRAVIILVGSLIILSIVLAVFAIREADRERLIKEKETEEELRRSAETVANQARTFISEVEQRVKKLLESRRKFAALEEFIPISESIVEGEEMIAEIFLADEKGNVSFPRAKSLFLLPGEENRAKEISADLEKYEVWRRAENAEIRTKNYSEAIDSYQKLLAETSDQGLKAFILSRVGRCHEKSRNFPKALEAYEKILEICPADLTAEGIPLGVMAWHQMGNVYLQDGKKAEAAGALLEFRQGLLDSRWPLTRSQFDYYSKNTAARFEILIKEMDAAQRPTDIKLKWDELDRLQEAQLSRMKIRENVRLRIAPRLNAKRIETGSSPGKFFHISDTSGEVLLLVSYTWLDEKTILALILSPEVLAQKLLPPEARKIYLREGWHLQVADESGNILAGEDISSLKSAAPRRTFTGEFEGNFPPWKINVYQTGLDSAKSQFQLRRSVYIFSALIGIAALFLGGFLAIRGTARELKLAKLKSDFVSTVSHEFRTPLMSIRYLAELLERGRVPDDQRKQQYYETITSESERLSRLVENILDFSKIEAGMKEYRAVETDIAALAADVASQFRRQAALKNFKLETEIAENVPRIIIDKEAVSRALFNLLDNAVKYSGENPRVLLRVRADVGQILLEVEDNGIGIGRSEQQKIFEKFYRSERALEGNVKGSGIGLTLVDHIVKAHGGSVLLESEVGKGTKVTIQLPLKPLENREGNKDG